MTSSRVFLVAYDGDIEIAIMGASIEEWNSAGFLFEGAPEWERVTSGIGSIPDPLWQHVDNANAWSLDGGETHYYIDEPLTSSGAPNVYCTECFPVRRDHTPKTLEEAVFQAIGAGSVAWDENGVFDEQFATRTGNDLVAWINEHYETKEN